MTTPRVTLAIRNTSTGLRTPITEAEPDGPIEYDFDATDPKIVVRFPCETLAALPRFIAALGADEEVVLEVAPPSGRTAWTL